MKLATYKKANNSNQIFGIKKNDELIDIYELSKHINENNNDNRFLLIPKTLKETLRNLSDACSRFTPPLSKKTIAAAPNVAAFK